MLEIRLKFGDDFEDSQKIGSLYFGVIYGPHVRRRL